MSEGEDLQRQGANARALGQSEIDNPFYLGSNLPAATGETIADWAAKEEAWRAGWMMEHAIRQPQEESALLRRLTTSDTQP